MEYSLIRESIIAREQRRDLLHQLEQDRLTRLARAGRKVDVKARRRPRGGLRFWTVWRKAAT